MRIVKKLKDGVTSYGVIDRIHERSVTELSFEYKGITMTVVGFYKFQYKQTLKYPHGPCLVMRGSRNNWIPAEVA